VNRRTEISQTLRVAVRRAIAPDAGPARKPQWQLARACGLHPVTLSNLMSGARDVEQGDVRIIALGQLLGIEPDQCFAATAVGDAEGLTATAADGGGTA
jgi:hypothetical protein